MPQWDWWCNKTINQNRTVIELSTQIGMGQYQLYPTVDMRKRELNTTHSGRIDPSHHGQVAYGAALSACEATLVVKSFFLKQIRLIESSHGIS